MTSGEHPIEFAAQHLMFELNALVDSLIPPPDTPDDVDREFEERVSEQLTQTPGLSALLERLRNKLESQKVWDIDEIEVAVDNFTLAAIIISKAINLQQPTEQ